MLAPANGQVPLDMAAPTSQANVLAVGRPWLLPLGLGKPKVHLNYTPNNLQHLPVNSSTVRG